MPSEIGFPTLTTLRAEATLTSDAFLNQKPNKQTMNIRRPLIAAVFHFVHPVEKDIFMLMSIA